MYETEAFAKLSADGPFQRIKIKRGNTGDDDVEFDVKFCGICHSDVHFALNEMGSTKYPIVPGHELAGIVTKVGKNVRKYAVGDHVGVGCIVDSCLSCRYCKEDDEIGCKTGMTMTYDSEIKYGRISTDSGYTFGGYSGRISVHQHFIIKVPAKYPLEAAGPVFCAGITMYTPLKQNGATKGGKKVGIVGIGGLGQMGIRLAAAMGNEVTAISTTPSKEDVARNIGASNFVISSSEESMKEAAGSMDLIINTIGAEHQASQYLPLLARRGNLVQLGLVLKPHLISQLTLMMGQIGISGSGIGGIADTQECIDFCAKKNIVCATEIIMWDQLQEVYEKLSGGNDRVIRYVLDVEKSLKMK